MRMCLNVICAVLAILAIGLVNFSCVSLSGFETQGSENGTYADLSKNRLLSKVTRPIRKMRMCLNVICEVLAILAIGLVNFSYVSLSAFETQGSENGTYADFSTGGWVREADISKCSRMPVCHPAFSEKACLTLL